MNSTIDLCAVRNRLAASKAEADAESARIGRENGIDWASNHASYAELRRLAKFAADVPSYQWDAQSMQRSVMDENDDAGVFLEKAFRYDVDAQSDDVLLAAWIDAALEVFDSVKQDI